MAQPFIGHVFVSYSRRDEAVMRRIAAFLRSEGLNVWVDNEKLIPGTAIWEEEIEKAISGAYAVVVLLSPDSKNSEWVRREITLTEQFRKRIFPVLVRGDENSSISLRLITRQYVDMREDELGGLRSLSAAIRFHVEEKETQQQFKRSQIQRRLSAGDPSQVPLATPLGNGVSTAVWVTGIAIAFCLLASGLIWLGSRALSSVSMTRVESTRTSASSDTPRPAATPTSRPTPTEILCFALLTPGNGTEVEAIGRVNFSWEAMPRAAKYLLEIVMPNGTVIPFESENPGIVRYAESMPSAGTYQWQVTAYDTNEVILCTAGSYTFAKAQSSAAKPTMDKSGDNQNPADPTPTAIIIIGPTIIVATPTP